MSENTACLEYVADLVREGETMRYDYLVREGEDVMLYPVTLYRTAMEGETVELGNVELGVTGFQKFGSWTFENGVYTINVYGETLTLKLAENGSYLEKVA